MWTEMFIRCGRYRSCSGNLPPATNTTTRGAAILRTDAPLPTPAGALSCGKKPIFSKQFPAEKAPVKSSLSTLAIAVLLCATAAGHGADVYKYKKGNVTTYSQLPPASGVATQRIHATPAAALPGSDNAANPAPAAATAGVGASKAGKTAGAAKSELTPEQQKLKAQLAKDSDTKLAELARRRADECTKAHGNFDELTQHARLRTQDAQGNWKILNDSERKQKLDEVQARIVDFCS